MWHWDHFSVMQHDYKLRNLSAYKYYFLFRLGVWGTVESYGAVFGSAYANSPEQQHRTSCVLQWCS